MVGIIPARAGFTSSRASMTPSARDHPRSRGVYPKGTDFSVPVRGSSPLARGLLPLDSTQSSDRRIIPARAGFTRGRSSRPAGGPDHPRSRGVYIRRMRTAFGKVGSSPLARGLRRRRPHLPPRSGIIPARAGFTAPPGLARRSVPDHPRSRGVYCVVHVEEQGHHGSSPLARGLRT